MKKRYSLLFFSMFLIFEYSLLAKKCNASPSSSNKSQPIKGKKMETIFAELDTTLGKIKIKLHSDKAPQTVSNFVGLAEGKKEFVDIKTGGKVKRPFYDGIVFHRVIPEFMIQTGDPKGNGTGGPGYTFRDEFHSKLKHNKPGI